MKTKKGDILQVSGRLIVDGIRIKVEDKNFDIKYPKNIWTKTPAHIKKIMLDNLTFGDTHFLPLILGYDKINYNTNFPIFESTLYRNQMMGMLKCEKFDDVPHLEYLRKFYNLKFSYANNPISLPLGKNRLKFTNKQPTAVIPFTFGKESLTTFALCRELGIKPVLVYSQEPSQIYEEKYKLEKIKEFKKKYNADVFFVSNGPGLFRYDAAFNVKPGTEIGWSSQTTLLTLQVLPFVYAYQAQYILLGNEYSNNEYVDKEGWQMSLSPDQNSFFTKEQNSMIQTVTEGNCEVHSSLESIEEINIFSMLHKRYTEIGRYQFSCAAEKPLYKDSQWCHNCYKCSRMFMFAQCLDIDSETIGFKENLLNKPGLFEHYFGKETKSGSELELEFCFYILHKKGVKSAYVDKFVNEKLSHLQPWSYYVNYFTSLHPQLNLPVEFQNKMEKIFKEELVRLKKCLPN